MAKRRLFKFFLSLVILFFVVGVMAVDRRWMLVMRGPSVPDHATLILRIGGELVETPPNDVFGQVTGGARAQTVRGYVDALRRAKNDPRIESVLIVPSHFESPYWGKVQEIRDAILDFRKSGKRISAYLEYGGEREYYLATAADASISCRRAALDVTGVATYEVFLEGHARQDRRAGRLREDRRLQDRAQSADPDDVHARASRDERVADARHVRAARARHRRRRARKKSRTCAR